MGTRYRLNDSHLTMHARYGHAAAMKIPISLMLLCDDLDNFHLCDGNLYDNDI